jgi:UDP-N-acetylmuramoyl-tripeptide--D-alanyl-D-alanine ligase
VIQGQLSEFAAAAGGEVVGGDVSFKGLSTDTRSLGPGQLFVALKGERFDAHRFLGRAVDAGAAALVVAKPDPSLKLPQLCVDDTLAGLGAIARYWRQRCQVTVFGVTGSNGKTTVKNLLASILCQQRSVLATQGNFNNDVGVPLTLARLAPSHDAAVVEMGCNRPGDIARLARLAQPDIAVVTNAGAAHLERLGSVEGVAREKGALFSALGPAGRAVVNADDPHADYWRSLIGAREALSFGVTAAADVRVSAYRLLARGESGDDTVASFELCGTFGSCSLHTPLPGEHNALNAAAAASAALLGGAAVADIVAGVRSVRVATGRLTRHRLARDILLIDDTYNANPASLSAAIAYLTALPGHAWLVLGDMAELGGDPAEVHARCGAQAVAAGVHAVLTLGTASAAAAEAARRAGAAGEHFTDVQALVDALAAQLDEGTNVLVKGSRSAGMERVVDGLLSRLEGGAPCSSS